MKTSPILTNNHNYHKIALATMVTIVLVLYFAIQAFASKPNRSVHNADTTVYAAIQQQILVYKPALYFPLSAERFYKANGYKLVWLAPDTVKTHASDAMLLLDCVLHYGLNHADYHPKELLYDELNSITSKWNKISASEKARFDLMLTDAMLNFMNNLHYGKLNPGFSSAKIDAGIGIPFKAEVELGKALPLKDFMRYVENSQPSTKEYADMQDHMRQLTGQYQDDCYEVPQEDIRTMAINLERMRWMNSDDKTYVEINIPAYTLKFYKPDTIYQFKTIVGTPINPTPTLQSAIGYFTTAPDWKIPHSIFVKETLPKAMRDTTYIENSHFAIYDLSGHFVKPTKTNIAWVNKHNKLYYATQSSGCDNALGLIVFRFPNIYDIYLHDTPEQLLFAKEERDFSHGCIRVEHAEKLAGLLLKNDGAANKLAVMRHALEFYQTKTFILKKPVPIKVTYLTCEVREGLLIRYKDIYDMDKSLESALYPTDLPVTMR